MDKSLLSIVAGLGGMFGWGTSDFFANLSSERIGYFKTFFWSQPTGIVFMLCLIPFFGLSALPSLYFILLIMMLAVLDSGGYLLFYKAFEIGNVSIVSATINLNIVFAMLIAFIFRGQRLTPLQTLAVALILIGITLVSVNFNDLKNRQFKLLAGVKETIISAIFFSVYWNLTELVSETIGWLGATLYVKIGATLFLLVFALLAKRTLALTRTSTKTKVIVALVGILEAAATASVNWGLGVGDLILVSPISSAFTVVTISMAVIFLKEKLSLTQTLGIALAITGIVLTAL
jgi:transporter family protein